MRTWPPLLVPVLALAATAQESPHAKPTTGTVTGHVYCADTNAPARLATVQLESVKDAEQRSAGHARPSGFPPGGAVQTTLDGSFTLSDVSPGSYYVVVAAPGYLSPRAYDQDFDNAEPQPPAGQPPIVIPEVDVEADQTASADIRLERGASVSGTVRYDDGSPASGLRFALLHKSKDEWIPSRFTSFSTQGPQKTDDLGHYRIAGLRGREYVVEVILSRHDVQARGPQSAALMSIDRSTLTVYSGDVTHRSDVVPFNLSAGEERNGEDITIPLSKLHSLGGVVVANIDGHTINAGFVHVSTPDDKDTVATAEIGSDGSFHLECVPEGTYLLQVLNARDRSMQELNAPGPAHMTILDEKVIHQYGDLKESLKVDRDIPSMVLTVPEQRKSATKNGQ